MNAKRKFSVDHLKNVIMAASKTKLVTGEFADRVLSIELHVDESEVERVSEMMVASKIAVEWTVTGKKFVKYPDVSPVFERIVYKTRKGQHMEIDASLLPKKR